MNHLNQPPKRKNGPGQTALQGFGRRLIWKVKGIEGPSLFEKVCL
jgi:hypothetical protein